MSRRVSLVTGGAGFIGSHLCDALLTRGDEVIALDDLRTGRRSNLESATRCTRFQFVEGSAGDRSVLEPLVRRSDRVFHLAASVGVAAVLADPVGTMQNNLDLAGTVSSVVTELGRPLVLTSTSEVYGQSTELPLREDGPRLLGPTSSPRWSYATAKATEETLAIGHGLASRSPVAIARMFNTVGPRQAGAYGMVVPRFVEAALEGRDLVVYGNGEQTRCFLDVRDAVDALLALADRSGEHESRPVVVNIGSTDSTSILGLARRIVAMTDSPSSILHRDPRDVFGSDFEEPTHRAPSIDRIHDLTGWSPRFELDDILAATIAWTRHPTRM